MSLKVFDYQCQHCGHQERDVCVETEQKLVDCPECGGFESMERVWLMGGESTFVHGDECDVTVQHGICNDDGSPRRFRSKSEMAKAAAEKGLVNYVEHIGSKGSDKNKHTQRFV